jgi:acetyl/propionyl-CoA carboxylase alpha subunit
MQGDLAIHGHAIEVRLYAEDPNTGFLPSIGKLERFSIPGDKVRVDTGVREGDTVTPFYDPMIAKVIAHANTRDAAAAGLADALAHTFVAGVKTNNAFLIRALRHKDFLAGGVDTGFIARHEHDLIPRTEVPEDAYGMAAGELARQAEPHRSEPWDITDSFRNSGRAAQSFDFLVNGKRKSVTLPGLFVRPNADVVKLANGDVAVLEEGETWLVHPYDPFEAAEAAGDAADRVATPMPGKIIQVLVKPGEAVKKGQPLAVLEAMKMEHTLAAPSDAEVATVEVQPGDQVPDGTVVVRFRQEEQKAA